MTAVPCETVTTARDHRHDEADRLLVTNLPAVLGTTGPRGEVGTRAGLASYVVGWSGAGASYAGVDGMAPASPDAAA